MALFLASTIINAQENLGITQNTTEALAAGSTALSSHGASSYFYNPARDVDGLTHLFEDWENSAIIHTSDKQHSIRSEFKYRKFQHV